MGKSEVITFLNILLEIKNNPKIEDKYKKLVPPYFRKKVKYGVLAAVLGFGAMGQFVFYTSAPLTVYFYDVGQGDAAHLRTKDGFDVLIDGGPTPRLAEKVGRTLPFWDRKIELMILTHPHADHLVGFIDILKQFEVEKVLATGVVHTTDEYLTWLKAIKEQGITFQVAQAGQQYTIGSGEEIGRLEILWPKENLSGKRIIEKSEADGGLNATSIVAKFIYGKTSFLFTGDAEEGVEKELVELYGGLLKSDVLKAGHHGSKTSTSKEFLQAVAPTYAVIQSGRKNRFGHPHFQTLWRLKQTGVEVLRNDQDGDVVFESDGKGVRIANY